VAREQRHDLLDFASYLLPLTCLELYLRARNGESSSNKFATAVVLLAYSA
jgi:hypothetical protein